MNEPHPGGRQQAVEAMRDLQRAMKSLSDALEADSATAARLEVAFQSTTPVVEVMGGVPMATIRGNLTARAHEFEAARKASRRAIIALLVAEGATPTDVGRIFGVSRQLASRLVLGLRDDPLDA
jgi:hypothetical protein